MKLIFWLLTTALTCGTPAFAAGSLTPDEQALSRYITEHKTEQLQLLKTLVNINSGTASAPGVRRTGRTAATGVWCGLGFHTRWAELPAAMKHAGSLVATHDGKGTRLLLIGHLDTVFPKDGPFQTFTLSTDGKTATGPGVIDDKGGCHPAVCPEGPGSHGRTERQPASQVVLTGG